MKSVREWLRRDRRGAGRMRRYRSRVRWGLLLLLAVVGLEQRSLAASCVGDRACEQVVNPIGMTFVRLPAGAFTMGDDHSGFPEERPQHSVTVPSFWIGVHEVTQGEWFRVMGENPAQFRQPGTIDPDARLPVEKVSWHDIQRFIRYLNQLDGEANYRLPSEAEWEYAARGGGAGPYGSGITTIEEHGWFNENAAERTHEVGQLKPNGWGLYDMHGNVWEWTEDCWHDSYRGAPVDGAPWLMRSCEQRVLRGGSWLHGRDSLRTAVRYGGLPALRFDTDGFRLVREP